jgi:hypothetical protein
MGEWESGGFVEAVYPGGLEVETSLAGI